MIPYHTYFSVRSSLLGARVYIRREKVKGGNKSVINHNHMSFWPERGGEGMQTQTMDIIRGGGWGTRRS